MTFNVAKQCIADFKHIIQISGLSPDKYTDGDVTRVVRFSIGSSALVAKMASDDLASVSGFVSN